MKRRISLLLSLAMLLSLFCGCQSQTNNQNGGNSSDKGEPSGSGTSNQEQVSLEFYIWDELQAPATQKMIDGFCETHSNVTIELTVIPFDQYIVKMQTVLSTGTGPDLCWINTSLGSQYMSTGALENLTPLIERDGYDVSELNQNIRDGYTYEDSLYAIPKDLDTVVVFYNKELFDRANVEYPNNSWTWEDFRETAKACTIEGTQYGYTNNNNERTYYSLIMANGGSLYNDKHTEATVNTDVARDAVQFLCDIANVDHSAPSGPEAIELGDQTLFMNGQAALDVNGSWVFPTYAESLGDKLGVAEMPTGTSGKSSISHGIGYAMPAGGKNVDITWEFLKYLGGAEAQAFQARDVIPANNTVANLWAEQYAEYDLSAVISSLEYSPILPLAAKNAASVRECLKAAIQEIWLGTSDIPSALAKAEEAMNAEISK